MNEPASQTLTVVVEREFPHPPDKVWRALTEAPLMSDWLMTTDFEPVANRPFTLKGDWGEVACRVTEIDPPNTLAYTWDAMGLESVVTWTLTAEGAGTHVRMEQTGFRPDQQQAFNGATYGWQKFIGELERVVAGIA